MSTSPLPPVRFRGVVALIGRFPALAGCSFTVAPGEVVLVAGPNGAGKTTLLRAIAGLQRIDRGEAEVLGIDLRRDRAAVRRAVAYVGHESFGYDDLTVRENLRFAARATGLPVDGVDDALARCGLARVADVRHGGLSAGQRRRLALARTLVGNAPLVLLDEPHAGLDVEGRAVLDALLASAPERGQSVVLVSHELDLARAHATREVQLVGGQIMSTATPATSEVSA
jgi:heme ABC exporter ATP-binding subunit CcmA